MGRRESGRWIKHFRLGLVQFGCNIYVHHYNRPGDWRLVVQPSFILDRPFLRRR